MSWHYYRAYESVAERRKKAQRKMDKLVKAGEEIQPVEPFRTRSIATSFWGQAWCRHLESFSDYENRLPRGRSYVRNGSVCHLGIGRGQARALVSGSSLYELDIRIQPLDPGTWGAIKGRCRGKIGSLIELLQGRISDEIMAVVTDRAHGLFPQPSEIRFNCNCPDWADMCKHVAAAMYGIGVRLDARPELLFTLRGVDHQELIAAGAAIDDLTGGRRSRRRALDSGAVGDVFGIELDGGIPEAPAPPPPRPGRARRKAVPFEPTGAGIRALRKKAGLTQAGFGALLGLSQGTVTRWENAAAPLKIKPGHLAQLEALHRKHGV